VITVESLLNGPDAVEYPLEQMVDVLAPSYPSKSLRTFLKDYVKKNFKSEYIKKRRLDSFKNDFYIKKRSCLF